MGILKICILALLVCIVAIFAIGIASVVSSDAEFSVPPENNVCGGTYKNISLVGEITSINGSEPYYFLYGTNNGDVAALIGNESNVTGYFVTRGITTIEYFNFTKGKE